MELNMDKAVNMMNQLMEFREGLKADYLSPEQVEIDLEKIAGQIDLLQVESSQKSNPLKSLMVVFNQSNYADMTVFFSKKGELPTIIEIAGESKLCEIISGFLKDDPGFYSSMEKLEISGEYYRVFSESMYLEDVVYTMLSVTLSKNFRSSDFHMLCDMVMDYTRSSRLSRDGIFCDLFDDTLIEMNSYITDLSKTKPFVYFFRYQYITDFFQKIGLATLIEMSDSLKVKLAELFGEDSYIIRISLSSYIVIALDTEEKRNIKQYMDKNKINFIYKGIVLPYMVIEIPYENSHSSYDIFENVYYLDNYLKLGDVRI